MNRIVIKYYYSILVPLICFIGISTTNHKAQTPKADEISKANGKIVEIGSESFKIIGTKGGFETKLVKKAPYSATIETESVQTMTDGNTITNKVVSRVYRDNEGRTRRENEIRGKGQKVFQEIFISDPANGINFTLDERQRQAFRFKFNLQEFKAQNPPLKTKADIRSDNQPSLKEKSVIAAKAVDKNNTITELLGKKNIEGIDCEGKRTIFTIEAGKIGNALPIKIVTEEWYSPELQVLILTVKRDPRVGETTYRLINIKLGSPNKILFEVPSDYTVIEGDSGKKNKSKDKFAKPKN